jgi:hypothetical protein
VGDKKQFKRTVSVFSNKLFSIYQWSNERSRRGQEGQDASVDQFLGEAFGERLIELKQKLGLGFIDSPISQFRYRFAYGFFIRLIFDQTNLDMLHNPTSFYFEERRLMLITADELSSKTGLQFVTMKKNY